MNDLTLIYYTSNRIRERFGNAVRDHLARQAVMNNGHAVPIICVSQKPLYGARNGGGSSAVGEDGLAQQFGPFGLNVWVGDIGATVYNVYRQILIAAKRAPTKYVACCEDDTLYCMDHFRYRPTCDHFSYNMQRWLIDPDPIFRYRARTGMCVCIAERDLMVATLEARFKAYPNAPKNSKMLRGWGEPGRYEKNLNLPRVQMEHFETEIPCVSFNHKRSLRGVRAKNPTDILKDELPEWGKADDLWRKFHG